ncbi:hypothetical protein K438DRAFT_1785059 [Mycena galopus ATCC 62051]|nr:hypothetical protein K438DRAFT_1785059 [Mycena galopus ATCC 62051]
MTAAVTTHHRVTFQRRVALPQPTIDAPLQLWSIQPSGESNAYTITNHPLNTRACVDGNQSITGCDGANSFSIEPAGPGLFLIKVPNGNAVWTAENPSGPMPNVVLKPQHGTAVQLWVLNLVASRN